MASINLPNTTIISKKLKIIEINVNSLIQISRRYDLSQFLKVHIPDIVLLNETKLNKKHKLTYERYNLIRRDRPNSNRGGGTAILVKNDIKHKVYTNNIIRSFKYLETTIIKIPMNCNKTLYVISAYYPSGNNDSNFKMEIDQLFESMNLQNTDNYYILGGDLNCKRIEWGNKDNNTKGNAIRNWLSENDVNFRCKFYASVTPSYPRSESFLDVCIADNRINIQVENNSLNCIKTLPYDSDHNALEIFASMQNDCQLFQLFKPIPNIQYNYKATNWEEFKEKIIANSCDNFVVPNCRNLENDEIDLYLNTIDSIIKVAIESVVPRFKENKYPIITNHVIEKLHREKSRMLTIIKRHNRMEITLSTNRLKLLKAIFKIIKKLIEDNFTIAINKQVEKNLTEINPKNSAEMFSKVRKNFKKIEVLKIESLKITHNLSHVVQNAGIDTRLMETDLDHNLIIHDEQQIVNVIGSYFEAIHSHKEIDNNNNTHTQVMNTFNEFLATKTSFERIQTKLTNFTDSKKANSLTEEQAGIYFVTQNNIIYIFKNLRGKVSSGLDGIPNIILKNLPEKTMQDYCTLFNNMINNSYFPNIWKKAKVVVIPKKDKDITNPRNLRPISLLPNISKIFEMCINNTINTTCKNNDLISDRQFGFKHKHSTINAINLLVSDINWNWNKKLCTGACLIDMEKAFDTIWIPGLIHKLINFKFPMSLVILIYNMIANKKFTVNNNCKFSRDFEMVNGLQQGTVNAPILFNLYIKDLIDNVENIISFADDIIIYQPGDKISQINNSLQDSFDMVEKFAQDWHMKINAEKCETILFRPPINKCNHNIKKNWKCFGIKSRVNNIEIQNREVVKYLGIYLDKFLYFNNHVVKAIEKSKKAFFMYKTLFYSKHLTMRIKILMYQSLIRPILTYGCPIWYNISPSYMERLRLFERKCLRACTSMYRSPQSNFIKFFSNSKLYNTANVNRIDNFIINLIRKHIARCTLCTEFNLIMAPFYTDENYIKGSILKGFVPPEAFLFLDRIKYIQNENGVPLFFHLYRRANIKSIDYNRNDLDNVRFDTSIPQRDRIITSTLNNKKFWWLGPQ